MADANTGGIAYTSINLPSRGALYDGKLPGGKVEIRKMTVAEEVILQSTSGGADLVGKLVAACTKLPPGFLAQHLLLSDRITILIALRAITFGPKYQVPYSCSACSAVNKADVDLNVDLKERPATKALVEPLDFMLPDAGRQVSLRYLRGSDEAAIAKLRKKDAPAEESVVRMALQITRIDGEDAGTIEQRMDFVRQLTIPDAMDMRETMEAAETGLDTRISPTCISCGEVNEMQMPMTPEFFRPARRRA